MPPVHDEERIPSPGDPRGEWPQYSKLVLSTMERLEENDRNLFGLLQKVHDMLRGDGERRGLFERVGVLETGQQNLTGAVKKRIEAVHRRIDTDLKPLADRLDDIETQDRETRVARVTARATIIVAWIGGVFGTLAALLMMFGK